MSLYSIDNCFTWDFMDNPELIEKIQSLSAQKEVFLEDRYRNRLDNLAYDYYHNVDLWWVLAIHNKIVDPMDFADDLVYLTVPYHDEVAELLKEYSI